MVRSNSIIYETMFKTRDELNAEKGVKDKDDEDKKVRSTSISTAEVGKVYSFEEALELTGDGVYNVSLLLVLSLTLTAMALDMFGFSVVVAGCGCDFQLDVMRTSILLGMPFAGPILMMFPWGYISDTQGRRKSLLISLGSSFVISTLSSLSPNWFILALMKLVSSCFCCCIQSSAYTLLGESCVERARGRYLLVMTSALMITPAIFFSIAYYILRLDFSYDLGPLGEFLPWRLLVIVLSLPLGIGWVGLSCFYESPKFLANEGRTDKALKVLKGIWKKNGGKPASYPVKHLMASENLLPRNREASLMKSIWSQTAPLFRPPYLMRSLQLFYIAGVTCATHNSFQMWFPLMVDNFFKTLDAGVDSISGLCDLVTDVHVVGNSTDLNDPQNCTSYIEDNTAISGVVQSILFALLSFGLSRASHRKKLLIIILFLISAASCVVSSLAPEPISALIFFILITITTLVMGLVSSYFVDLYPTSYRGMASSLGVVVGRLAALAGSSIVGGTILSHCNYIFYGWSVFLMSGVVVAAFLPGDIRK